MTARTRSRLRGFTLIELMIVVAIIGILATVAVPKFLDFLTRSKVAKTVAELQVMVKGFELYALEHPGDNRGYPDDTDLVLPAGVEDYVDAVMFGRATPFGGRYNWDGPNFYDYAGLAIQNPTGGDSVMAQVDSKLDDGNLNTGQFRKTPNSRYTYVLWDK